VADLDWERWLGQVYSLRRDKRGSHERPHKPVLLLSLIDLLDRGFAEKNAFPLSEELVRAFKRYFAVVRQSNDQPTIEYPYLHLSGDGFWTLVPTPGRDPAYRPGETSGAPSVAALRRNVSYGTFEAGFWELLKDPGPRHQLRESIIARYFPDKREELASLIVQNQTARPPGKGSDELPLPPARDAAFRRTILEVYDFCCAACGIRVLLHQRLALVEAAHLIPFEISRNDMPTNGVALCPNHHWAMDHHLIAPCPDPRKRAGVWRVNERQLDDRLDGQRDLLALGGKPVIPPREEKFFPAPESLRWREHRLCANA
jgi:putative restriction endonuclease